MSDIVVKKKNEVYLTLQSEPHIHHELSDYFSFELPEAKFLKRQPRFKYWDGMIRLYSPGTERTVWWSLISSERVGSREALQRLLRRE